MEITHYTLIVRIAENALIMEASFSKLAVQPTGYSQKKPPNPFTKKRPQNATPFYFENSKWFPLRVLAFLGLVLDVAGRFHFFLSTGGVAGVI